MNIKVGRKYRTRNGGVAEIKSIMHPQCAYPVHGHIEGTPNAWLADGRWKHGEEDSWDLVEDLGPILTLSIGKQYRMRNGNVAQVTSESDHSFHGIYNGRHIQWTKEGRNGLPGIESPFDIIEEVQGQQVFQIPSPEEREALIKQASKVPHLDPPWTEDRQYRARDGQIVTALYKCENLVGTIEEQEFTWRHDGSHRELGSLDIVSCYPTFEGDPWVEFAKVRDFGKQVFQAPSEVKPKALIEEAVAPTATFAYAPGTILRLKSGEKFKVYEEGFDGLINGAVWVRVPPGGWGVFAVSKSCIEGPWKEEPPAPWKPITEPLAGKVLALTVPGTVIIGFAIRMIGDKWVANDRPGNEYTVTHYTEIPPTE